MSVPSTLLPGIGARTSALGFGCSRLIGPLPRAQSLRLLDEAFELGVRHFDVARAYGSGDAEGLLGRALRHRRDEVTITTKFGLMPPVVRAGSSALRGAARRLMRLSPTVRRILGRQGARMVSHGAFSAGEARASLETSLRELGTHIDLLLLHEPSPEHCTEELLRVLIEARERGDIRGFGIGTDGETALEIIRCSPEFCPAVQVRHAITDPAPSELIDAHRARCLTHGALSGLAELRGHVALGGSERAVLLAAGIEPDDAGSLPGLALRWAGPRPDGGPVVFSTTDSSHLREAVAGYIAACRVPPASLDRLAARLAVAAP